jgi:SNF2 family DNA or RNA helicase
MASDEILKPEDLLPYQLYSLKFAYKNPLCALFLDMGLGKTIITLTLIELLTDRLMSRGALVLAPLHVVYNTWEQEAVKWAHTRRLKFRILHGKNKDEELEKPADIYLMNYEGINWLNSKLKKRLKWKRPKFPFDILISDESTKMKDQSTKRFKKLRPMLPIFTRRIILTGLPAPNSLIDLWAQYFILDRGKRLGTNFTKFRKEYFFQDDYESYRWFLRLEKKNEFIDKVKNITLHLPSEYYITLPEFRQIPIYVDLPEKLRKQYNAFEDEFFISLDKGEIEITAANSGVLQMKLRQYVQGFLYYYELNEAGEIIPKSPRHTKLIHSFKLEVLKERLESLNGNPTIIAFNFEEEYLLLTKELKAPCLSKTKDMDEARNLVKAWNAGQLPILLLNPSSVSHGLNMQFGGHNIIMYSLTWNLEHDRQLMKRLHRRGQKSSVRAFYLIAKRTVDEAIFKALKLKDRTQADLLSALKHYRIMK